MRTGIGIALLLLAATAAAQMPFSPGGRPPTLPTHPGSTAGLPLLSPIPPLGGFNPGFGPVFGGGFQNPRNAVLPAFWGGYGGYYPGAYSPVTNILMVASPQAPEAPAPQPPPAPVRSEVREYKNTDFAADAPAEEPQYFVLAMKDGSRPMAVAVWVQGNELRYIAREGSQVRVPLANVDRRETQELNRARNLNLRLP